MEISLVGRANVGKSSIFNALTRSQREALTLDFEGLTRDRKRELIQGLGEGAEVYLNDLAGLETEGFEKASTSLSPEVQKQAWAHLTQSDGILMVVDARTGPHAQDFALVQRLQRKAPGIPIALVINKAEFQEPSLCQSHFFELGLGAGIVLSSAHRQGFEPLMEILEAWASAQTASDSEAPRRQSWDEEMVLLGRPNVGKSTLMNQILGWQRVLTDAKAGTTRESIAEEGCYKSWRFRLVDTAGIRPRSSVASNDSVEQGGVQQALKSLENAPMALLVLDVHQGATHQDRLLLQRLLRGGKATVLVVNKADDFSRASKQKAIQSLREQLGFAPYLPIVVISAKERQGLSLLWKEVLNLRRAFDLALSTAKLNRVLNEWVEKLEPPVVKSTQKRPRLKYIHQLGRFPLKLIVRGNQLQSLPEAYKKYIESGLRKSLSLPPVPLLLQWSEGENPFA